MLVDGLPQAQNVPVQLAPADVHIVSELQQPGYKLQAITCNDDLTHGAVKNYDGAIDLAPGQHVTCNLTNDEIAPTITVHKIVVNDNGGTAQAQDFQPTINSNDTIELDTPYPVTANKANVVSETGSVPGYVATMIQCTSDIPDSPQQLDDARQRNCRCHPGARREHRLHDHQRRRGQLVSRSSSKCRTTTVATRVVADFPLQVNGAPVTSGQSMSFTTGVGQAIAETQQAGYTATDVTCVSSDPNSVNNVNTPNPEPTALAVVSLAATESVMCTVTNDDIAPTVTVHKVVVGGTAVAGDFQLTLGGNPVNQDQAIPTISNQAIEVSEVPVAGYDQTSVGCTDNGSGASVVHPMVLDEGQNVTCTVTNTFRAPMITVAKTVTNDSGGGLAAADFQLTLDGVAAAQNSAIEVQPGPHVVGEVTQPGYLQTGIECKDNATGATVGAAGSVVIGDGQQVTCTVSNDDIPATLTVSKQLIVNNGGQADPASFQLKIDDVNVPQNAAQSVAAGNHTIGEVVVPGWRLTAINCSDNVTKEPVSYSGGIALALGQHVTCFVFNDDLPIDLSITKTDDGLIKVAGGAPFDYTITVDNVGPGDVGLGAVVTVTDQLPVGFDFVAFPATCSAVGQALTCSIAAADLHVADPPVVITVSVKAHPDIATGTYTNKAFVDTGDDPACVGVGCVPVCGSSNNNVACQDTDIRREASITIDKHDDVLGGITPGADVQLLDHRHQPWAVDVPRRSHRHRRSACRALLGLRRRRAGNGAAHRSIR